MKRINAALLAAILFFCCMEGIARGKRNKESRRKDKAKAAESVLAPLGKETKAANAPAAAKHELVVSLEGKGVYCCDSDTGKLTKLAKPATRIALGDLDHDGVDDLIGVWPGQPGLFVQFSQSGKWERLSKEARDFSAGDMDGDGRLELLATWDDQGVFYRAGDAKTWVKLAGPASQLAAGDLDGDGKDDLIGTWPKQKGIWAKYSGNGAWVRLASEARDFTTGDMDGDGRTELLATWDNQGVLYRVNATEEWVKLAAPATHVAAGDLDGDGQDDLIGNWPEQKGVWARYSRSGSWTKLSKVAMDIASGRMRSSAPGSISQAGDSPAASSAGRKGFWGSKVVRNSLWIIGLVMMTAALVSCAVTSRKRKTGLFALLGSGVPAKVMMLGAILAAAGIGLSIQGPWLAAALVMGVIGIGLLITILRKKRQ